MEQREIIIKIRSQYIVLNFYAIRMFVLLYPAGAGAERIVGVVPEGTEL
jgi:hypothetical protein